MRVTGPSRDLLMARLSLLQGQDPATIGLLLAGVYALASVSQADKLEIAQGIAVGYPAIAMPVMVEQFKGVIEAALDQSAVLLAQEASDG